MPLSPARLTPRGVLSPNPFASAQTTNIKDAIMRGNVETVEEKLSNAALSTETLQDLLKYAFDRNSNPAIKEAFLEHGNCNPESALALAVQYNDIALAKQAMRRGADPEKITVNNRPTEEMRKLLTYARRLNKLYPPGCSTDTESDLDRALRNGMLDDDAKTQACSLLEQKFPEETIPQAWQHAVKNKQLDVQRAILLLLADTDPYFRVLQDAQATDKGVAKVMKEIPYFSPKRGWPENFNCMASFLGKKISIECRHLVEHMQKEQQQHPQGKFDYAQFASLEAITAHVSYDTEANYNYLSNHAAEVHLLHNHDFGLALAQQLTALATQGALPQSKFILLKSIGHAMSVQLTVKEEGSNPCYVANFFDPTCTTSHVRVASASLRTFDMLKLENFVSESEIYDDYYPASENLSAMFVRPASQNGQAGTESAQEPVKNRIFTSSIKDEEINAAALHHMLANGFSGDLRLLKNKIKIDKELLAAKRTTGTPGLFTALQNGYTDTIKAFGELLELVPTTDRAELLASKTAKGLPGFGKALQEGHADAIKAFGELLKLVPSEKERTELLAAKSTNGVSGLSMALFCGQADAVKAFGELLELVSPKERAKLLAPKDAKGTSGLAQALKGGKLEALEQYIAIIMKTAPALNAQERADLLTYIRKSHAVQRLRMWFDLSYYSSLKEQHPDFYACFKKMENDLKS